MEPRHRSPARPGRTANARLPLTFLALFLATAAVVAGAASAAGAAAWGGRRVALEHFPCEADAEVRALLASNATRTVVVWNTHSKEQMCKAL